MGEHEEHCGSLCICGRLKDAYMQGRKDAAKEIDELRQEYFKPKDKDWTDWPNIMRLCARVASGGIDKFISEQS